MCCIAEIAMLIFGIIALATGNFTLSRNKVVQGVPARLIGVVLMLPLPLALAVTVAMGGTTVIGALQQGQEQVDQRQIEKMQSTIRYIEMGLIAVCFISAVVIALATAKPKELARPVRRDDDDNDRFGDRGEDEPRQPRRPPDDRFQQ